MTTITPYDWQLKIAQTSVVPCLEQYRLFISGFNTGVGKTIIALTTAKLMGCPHLVIAPKAALSQWRRAAEAMGVSDLIIDVINPEQISKASGCRWYNRKDKWKLPAGTVVIWDEPHRSCSGVDGHTTLAMAELKAYTSVKLHAMTATLADSPLKLRGLGWWAGLHKFNLPSFYDWCRHNGCATESFGIMSPAQRRVFRFTRQKKEAAMYMDNIRQSLGPKFQTINIKDIPDFPTESRDILLIDLEKREQKEIIAAQAEMSERMKSMAKSDLAEVGRQRERVEFIMAEAVVEQAANLMEDGNSVLVFFNFTAPRQRFEAKLAERKITVASIYGGQKDEARQNDIDAFQRNDVHIMSVMSEAGGAALSLHDERKERPRVSLILPSWKASTIAQCFGRIRRCNGTHATQYLVVAAGTVQQRVLDSLQQKLRNFEVLNNSDIEF